MRITVLTIGSRGDVRPYVALSAGLRAAGHEVRLATHARFRDDIETRGLMFRAIDGDPRELIRGRAGRAWLASGGSTTRFARRFLRLFRPLLGPYLRDVQAACAGSEAIIFAPLTFAAWHVAEALGVPALMAAVLPATRTRAFPAIPAVAPRGFGGAFNLATHVLYEQLVWQALRPAINAWRRESLGLRPLPLRGPFRQLRQRRAPVLYGFSPLVVPKPPDWPPWCRLTGYWFLEAPAEWTPPARMLDFLDAGPPPVYVGFGSMMPRDPAATITTVMEALTRAGVRGIIATGWTEAKLDAPADHVLIVGDVPHDWLFPRVAAVVHHGGAGTTATGIRAGRSTVVVPFFGDQPFWARRVEELGVGPEPIPIRQLTASALADGIRAAVEDAGIRRRALELGEQLRAENGVARAVEAVGELLGVSGASGGAETVGAGWFTPTSYRSG